MSFIRFIWDKKGVHKTYIDLEDDFEVTKNNTRETLIYGSLAIEELCFYLYKKYIENNSNLTQSRLIKFRNMSFAEKVNSLEILGVIEFSCANKMKDIKDVRNHAAHNLIFEDIIYKGKKMPEGLQKFKEDCLELWEILNKKIES